jgi:tricorn protease
MSTAGYYRFPAIHGDRVVFVADDDLWAVPRTGGVARRLTANLSAIEHPFFSPDGTMLALTAREEGQFDVYTMPSDGGPLRRVTYLGAKTQTIGWSEDGSEVLLATNVGQPFERAVLMIHSVPPGGGAPRLWPLGHAMSISVASGGRIAIGRNNSDPARWKRYRGGTAGEIWVDATGSGEFEPLIRLNGNIGRPMWIGKRVFFLSDHEGTGNLYSCMPDGADLKRHTHHEDYYARFPNSDGRRIVYHAGADLYVLDPSDDSVCKIEVEWRSPRVQRARRFVDAARFLESYAPHPEGHSLAITTRGRSFTFGNWEGPVIAQEAPGGEAFVRYRRTHWLNDGRRLVTITDRSGEERLEIHDARGGIEPVQLTELDIGHVEQIRVSPVADQLLLANHRHELLHVDLERRSLTVVARSAFRPIAGLDWSPDGRWAAFAFATSLYSTGIRLWNRETGECHDVTEPVLLDVDPVFDPDGKYLYFLGYRELDPVYDTLQFELGFPRGIRPYLVTLQADEPSPFQPRPRPLDDAPPRAKEGTAEGSGSGASAESPGATPLRVDLDGIERRVVAFPVPDGRYGRLGAIKGKLIYTSLPIEGALAQDWRSSEPEAKATLEAFDLGAQKAETLARGVSGFELSKDGKTLVYRAARRLRVLRAGQKADDSKSGEGGDTKRASGRDSGWIDFDRVRVSVEPASEWRQMAREAWRLQREHFWTADMSQVDWNEVWVRYAPLLERIGTRGEFSDLMWEMQGELGTSHAYEMGGDYRSEPAYTQGWLGADLDFDAASGQWRFARIVEGTAGEAGADSPLRGPGVGVRAGETLLAINGHAIGFDQSPGSLLVHQAGTEVSLTVIDARGQRRDVTVRTLRSEHRARYREWVERNRRKVHAATGGRIGYLHIPDMGPRGYSEFHRLWLVEAALDGLIVDVRFNGGGHVSQLLIEKLRRRPVGYDVSRWGSPEPYPAHAIPGPLVAVTNEGAGSDGDIFSHVFKLMKLGPLIGKRTWGGVIGISPRRALADGAITTQPEYSFWFEDVGWGVENYGTEPDIEVDMAPQDFARGVDPQLDRAIAVALEKLQAEPVIRPAFDQRPSLKAPKLGGRRSW